MRRSARGWAAFLPVNAYARWGLLIALWLLALAWIRPLSDPDEGRYAVAALDMLRTGDWVTPRLNGLPFFHKPPLYYWLAALGYQLFGVHEWVARLPAMLGAWLAAMGLLVLVRQWVGAAAAKASVLVFVTMPFVYLAAQYSNMDMLLAGCMTACTVCAVVATCRSADGQCWRLWITMAGVFAGLGFLAKGLIGIVLPGMVWCAWLLWERRWRQGWLPLYPPVWLALWLVAAPWALLAQQRHPSFFHYFFVTQHFQRYTETGFNNPQPWWFYLGVILLACLPWTALGVIALIRLVRSKQLSWPALVEFAVPSTVKGMQRQQSLDRLMLAWLFIVVAFFSVPRSKIVGYVLPALPPLAYGIYRLWRVAFRSADGGLSARWAGQGLNPLRGFAGALALAALLCASLVIGLGTKGVPAKGRWGGLSSLPVQPDDRIMMLGRLYYEIPFYLRTRHPAWVVNDWQQSAASKADNWKNELTDAATFAPDRAQQLLQTPDQAVIQLCTSDVPVWVVGELPLPAAIAPMLQGKTPVWQAGKTQMWRFEPGQPINAGCLPSTH